MQYRADIDGLRAIAIATVVAYHAEVEAFAGGFVGVDVFFVISGFLITSQIAEEIREGRFSTRVFWARRARRLLPALGVVLAATLALGYAVFLPADFRSLSDSAASAVLFGSNIHFWRTVSYFDNGAGLDPLLHTWSLAVEEQFYLVFPLAMIAGFRWLGKPVALLLALFAASFTLAAWGATHHPQATFYLTPSRFWELLLGALLALAPVASRPAPRLLQHAAGLAGIGLIAWSVFVFDESTVFPGLNALWPCLGAGLVIWAREGVASRALRLPPLVFLGLISYSLYLWHWPVLVFARYEGYLLGDPFQTAAAVALSVALAILSWRYVETPAKSRLRSLGDLTALRLSGTVVLASCLLFVGVGRSVPAGGAVIASAEPGRAEARAAYGEGTCFFSSGAPLASIDPARCLEPHPGRSNYLLMGDSFAAHLWPGLRAALPGKNLNQLTFGGCPPLPSSLDRAEPGCRKVTRAVFQAVEETRYDVIFIAAHWKESHLPELRRTLVRLKERSGRVVLVGPIVQYSRSLPQILAASSTPDRSVVKYRTLPDSLDRRMRTLAHGLGIEYVSLVDAMCRGERCLLYDVTGQPIQWDNGHLTPPGSVEIVSRALETETLPMP